MAEGSRFDIVLFGFRNDLAQARTIEYLHRLPPSSCGPLGIAPARTPQRLFTGLDQARAQEVRATLETLGAQVSLIRVAPPRAPEISTTQSAPALVSPARPSGLRRLTLVLVALLGGAVFSWQWHTVAPRLRSHPLPPRQAAELEVFNRAEATGVPAAVELNADAVHLAESGQFREAQERLEAALRLSPDHPVVTRNLQTVLANWGFVDLNAGKLDEAIAHLEQAAQLGERADVLRALGTTYLQRADYARAAATLERALALAPTDANTMVALAETYLQGDLDPHTRAQARAQALDLLQRAKEAGARGPDVEKRVQQLSREVDAEWDFVQLESAHFRVSFADNEERSTVDVVLDAFEEAYETVGGKFDHYPDEQTSVVLYTQQDFHAITRTPDWAGAAFDGRIKLPVRGLTRNDPNLPRTARHEYAHSLVARMAGNRCPGWLSEGLAVWAEETEDGEREGWALDTIAGQELFKLDALRASFTRLPADRVAVAYAESYLAVRRLIGRYGARGIPALLTAVREVPNPHDAFAAVYPENWARFQEDFLQQLLRG